MKAWGILVSALLVAAGAQAKTNLTIEHLNKLNKIYDVQVSPDGRYVVYGQKNGGLAPADTTADLYVLDVQDGNKVRRLTESASREHDVRFNADGTALYFLADRSGSSQLWRLPLTGKASGKSRVNGREDKTQYQ